MRCGGCISFIGHTLYQCGPVCSRLTKDPAPSPSAAAGAAAAVAVLCAPSATLPGLCCCFPADLQEVDIEHELGIELAHDDDDEEHEEEKHEGVLQRIRHRPAVVSSRE